MIVMARKTSGDSSRGVPGIIFPLIQDSFTTQGLLSKARPGSISPATTFPVDTDAIGRITRFFESRLNIAGIWRSEADCSPVRRSTEIAFRGPSSRHIGALRCNPKPPWALGWMSGAIQCLTRCFAMKPG
jgi:hypothetical protein